MKLLMVVGVLLALSTASSWAMLETFLPGNVQVTMKFTNYDVGTQYHNLVAGHTYTGAELAALPWTDPGGGAAWRQAAYGAVDSTDGVTGLEDSWGIFQLKEITDTLHPSQVLWSNQWLTGDSRLEGLDRFEVTGIFWGQQDFSVLQDADGTQHIVGNDLSFAFFEDATLDFTDYTGSSGHGGQEWNGGPSNRATPDPVWDLVTNDGPGVAGPAGWPAGSPLYGGAGTSADSAPIITGYSVPGRVLADPNEFFSTFNPSAAPGGFTGTGGFLGTTGDIPYWGIGSLNNLFGEIQPDIKFDFSFTGHRDPYNWIVKSDDPILAVTTPELSSSILLLLGLVPIGLGWRKRKTA